MKIMAIFSIIMMVYKMAFHRYNTALYCFVLHSDLETGTK